MKSFNIGDIKINVPIIQGGMGVGISLSGLASAVANQGGVGVISSAGLGLIYSNLSKDYMKASILGLKEELKRAREKTRGVIGVNIMVAMSNFADMVKTSIAEKADIIFSGAGLPLDLPSFLTKDSKTKLVPIVSSVRAFKILCDKWKTNYDYLPDAVVVEGPKAGGHLGYKKNQIFDPKFALEETVPEVVAYAEFCKTEYGKEIPVIAAGGIYNGEDIYKMETLGASAFQLGSKFVTTEECDANIDFKNTYINAKEQDISIIASPVGMPGRAIEGEFTRLVEQDKCRPKNCPFHCIKTCDYTKSPYCIMLALYNASKGNLNRGYAFAGSNAYRAEKITSVKDTMDTLINEYETITKN
ncbi:MAG: nitronate monooxygenase family protein [Rikenellaceae bacterium]